MHRRHLIGLVVTVAAAFLCGLDRGRPLPAAFAAGREIMIEGVTEGRYADPFLGAAEGLVRSQGYQGDFADLVGMSGLADEATMCRQDCDCREVLHSADRLQALVAPLGGNVTPFGAGASSPEAAWEALQRELTAGRPVMAEGLNGPASLNLVVGCDPASQKVIYLDEGERRERSFAAWTQGPWGMSTARVRTTRLPGPKAEREAVVSMLVRARQPRIEGGCPIRQERTQNALGLEAYRLWTERALSAEPADPKVQQLRARSWMEHRQMLVKFLRGAARHQDPDTARRFREAADAAQQELDKGLRPLAKTTTAPRNSAAATMRERQASLLRMAVKCQKRFLQAIEPVAFRHLRLSPEQRRLAALNAAVVDRATADVSLRQLLQARDSRVRTLGSMAAAVTGDATLAPDLAKNLAASDPLEARASLAALKIVNPDNLAGLLEQQRDAMRVAGGQVGGTDAPIKQVDYALADLKAREPHRTGLIVGLTGGPVLFWILGLAVVGLGLVAWKITGPVRLASRVEEPIAPRPGLPEEAARLQALLMRPPATGLMLTHVSPDGPAFRQGLRTGDVICRYGDAAVASLEDLRRLAGQPGAGQREIVARRDLRTVKTVVSAGPIGVNGVTVTRGQPFWRPLATAPYVADTSGLAGDGETWHRFTQNGRPIGFERRRRRWVKNDDVEICCVAGFAAEGGEEHLRVIHRLRTGEQLTCASTKFATRGQRSVDLNATCSGGRWVILLNGKSLCRNVPEKALPSHTIATFAATLPFEVGRAYDVVRADEFDFQPSYGCQIVCLGPEIVEGVGGQEKSWRFELMEYGVRQIAFWFNPARQLVRAEYAGLVSTLTTREEALAGLPPSLCSLADED